MSLPLFLVVTLGLAGAFSSPLEDPKICKNYSRPWQVYLSNGRSSCSGALVDEWWIVTSFSCAQSSKTVAYLGKHDVTTEETTQQEIHVAEVILHSPYRSPLHSLAMVRLAEPARFTPYVQPIALPTRCPQVGETCYVSGWGSTTPNQDEPDHYLKCITVPIVDSQSCMNTFPEYVYWSMGMVCAGQAYTDNCLGDQGSVMVCDGQLQGVQWFDHGCQNSASPTVYTKLCLYNQWINNVMISHGPTQPPPTSLWRKALKRQ
ncbi:uncharacterized protein V6R79_011045 [Siganus canaliculatus]